MLVNVELYADPTKPTEPYKVTVDVPSTNRVMCRTHRGSDFSALPERDGGTLVIRLYPEPTVGPPSTKPTISSVSPSTIVQSQANVPIIITGTNFVAGCTAYVNGTYKASTVDSPTQMTITAYNNDGPGTKNVMVMNGTGEQSNTMPITVTP